MTATIDCKENTMANDATEYKTTENSAPAVTLVPAAEPPKEKPKRRATRPGPTRRAKPSAKDSGTETIFVVETEEGSEQFAVENIKTIDDFLDIMDDDRQILVSRTWRRF
jgi:hypothetical protein